MADFINIVPGWLELVSLAFCIGALVCRLFVFTPSAGAEFPRQGNIAASMWRLFCICLGVIIASSIADLLMRGSEMSRHPVSDICPVLPTIIFRTHFGRVWLIRIAAVVFLLIMLISGKQRRGSKIFLTFMLGIAVIIALTESASGHASDKGDFSVREIMDWLHLLAASVWGGGLFALSIVILPELVKPGGETAPLLAVAAKRFSKIAGVAVGIIAVTALYNAWVYVCSAPAFWTTPYGRIVLAKVFLFFLLINLGAFNHYISVPLLQEWGGFSAGRTGVINRIVERFGKRFILSQPGYKIALRFKRNVKVEAILMIGVLLCAAMLRHEIPARHYSHLGHTRGTGHEHGAYSPGGQRPVQR